MQTDKLADRQAGMWTRRMSTRQRTEEGEGKRREGGGDRERHRRVKITARGISFVSARRFHLWSCDSLQEETFSQSRA
eukprot:760408-Hanusia_phi.AAC.1